MRLVTMASIIALVAAPAAGADRQIERMVARHVRAIVPPDGAGGVAVALRIEGQTLFFNYGWADRANKRPITTDTLFNLASLRKVFETTLLAQAVGNGELRLDDPSRQICRRAGPGRRYRPRHARPARDAHVRAAAAAGPSALAGLGLHAAGVHPHAQCLEGGQDARSAASLYSRGLCASAPCARASIRHADRRADRAAAAAPARHDVDRAAAAG